MTNEAAIGIFDSGVGGLTVARAVLNVLPREEIRYVGDTAHTPYGKKTWKLCGAIPCLLWIPWWNLG